MNKTLKEYSEIAHNILNKESRYSSNKIIISSLFNRVLKKENVEAVKNRLTIIDSYYSTQMNKRLYGIEQLADKLSSISDKELKDEILNFLKTPQNFNLIKSILNEKYGINKEGKQFGKAISLISKYLYFLNNYNFPIFDNLAYESYSLLKRNIYYSSLTVINEENYFTSLKHLNNISDINDFEKLDNLLWLLGKLKKGSFSIIMDIDKYLEITSIEEIKCQFDLVNSSNKKNKSVLKDGIIRNYIGKNYKQSNLFNKEEIEIFDFVFGLK